MKVGVYVGSFDPVHKGHKQVIDNLLDNNYVDRIEVITTYGYWDKTNLIDINHRINMLKFYENDKIHINETLNHYEYTYQVLNELKKTNDELYLIIGSDNLPKFNLWKNVDEILNNKVLVIPRKGYEIGDYINQYAKKENFIITNSYEQKDISSTKIRELIKSNKITELKDLLDKEILKYIIDNNLYRR